MKPRLVYVTLLLIGTGILFYASNQVADLTGIENSLFITAVMVNTITCVSLALGSLTSVGIAVATRNAALPLLFSALIVNIDAAISLSISITAVLLLSLYSQRLLSSFATDTGAEREDVFLLTSPISITLWISFGFIVCWTGIIQSLNLIFDSNALGGALLGIIPLIVMIVFIPLALRVPLRRCVIVPHGVVIADHVAMTDTVLLPLSKIKTIELVEKLDVKSLNIDSSYIGSATRGSNLILISLNEKTDSLILRKNVNETERVEVDKIFLSLSQPKFFFNHFYKRFHKIEPEDLTPAKEKMIEKQLGIETAPRSDSPLPSWKNRKKKNN